MSTVNMEQIRAFLYRESRLLDDEQWDDWLACYHDDAEFWMPSWDDDDTLVSDPQREISLIYYPSRQGLEDRVFRIKTERSSATMPDTRTSHNISNVELVAQDGAQVTVRFNWHTLSHRYKKTDHYFGTIFATLRKGGEAGYLFARKKVVLKDDYISQVVDIYHI